MRNYKFYYPKRFGTLLHSHEAQKRYGAYMAIKAREIEVVLKIVAGLGDLVKEAYKDMRPYQDKHVYLQKIKSEIESEPDTVDRASKLGEIIQKIQENQEDSEATYEQWRDTITAEWLRLMSYQQIKNNVSMPIRRNFELMDTFSKRKNEVIGYYAIARLRDVVKSLETEVNKLIDAGRLSMMERDTDRYIGNSKVVSDFSKFYDAVNEIRELYENNFPRGSKADVDKKKANVKKLVDKTKEMTKVFNLLVDQKAGLIVEDQNMTIKVYLGELEKAWDEFKKAWDKMPKTEKGQIYPQSFRILRDEYEAVEEHIETMLAANRRAALVDLYQELSGKKRQLFNSSSIAYTRQVEGTEFTAASTPVAIDWIENVLMERYKHDINGPWYRLTQDYPELVAAAPDNAGFDMTRTLNNPPVPHPYTKNNLVEEKIDKPFQEWLDSILDMASIILDFAKLYTAVKSAYIFTVALKSRQAVQPYGKSVSDTNYQRSMDALVDDALAGKSLSSKQLNCLKLARFLYPKDTIIKKAFRSAFNNRVYR